MPVQNEKCRNKSGDSKAEKVRAGGEMIAVANVRITDARGLAAGEMELSASTVTHAAATLATPSDLMAANAQHESHKTVDELLKLFFRGVAHDPPTFVEDGCRARYKQASTKPGSRPQCAQHWQPRLLAEDRAEAAR